jgi:hypothetical protein
MNEFKIVSANEVFGLIGLSGVVFTLIDKLQAPLWASISLTLIIVWVSLLIIVRAKWLKEERQARKNRFEEGRDKGGESCLADIRAAQESILLTHFSAEVPDPIYLQEIQKKIDSKLHVLRILTSNANPEISEYEWLKTIIRNSSYVQYLSPYDLPFNMIIIDRRIVWLFFPTEPNACYFNKAISFRSDVFASHLKVVFDKMVNISKLN